MTLICMTTPNRRNHERQQRAPCGDVVWRDKWGFVHSIDSHIFRSFDLKSNCIDMESKTVSPKYQVVIPQSIGEALHLKPGEMMRVLRFDNRVEYIPVRSTRCMRGFLKGMDTTIEREDDDRLCRVGMS